MTPLLLGLSILLSTGRNLLSKRLSGVAFRTREFFVRQSLLFGFGALSLLLLGAPSLTLPSRESLLLATAYAILLLLAQWCYTVALAGGKTALCSTVYSMGFILPTLSGCLFFGESFSPLDLLGILCAVGAVAASYRPERGEGTGGKGYFFPLVAAMLSSGGLGILQKVQQAGDAAEERPVFLLLAFLMAAVASLPGALAAKRHTAPGGGPRTVAAAAGVGIAFGSCNLLNTVLAGRLASAVFFPTLNIGVILLTMLCGILLFRERLGRRELAVLLLGAASILLLTLG